MTGFFSSIAIYKKRSDFYQIRKNIILRFSLLAAAAADSFGIRINFSRALNCSSAIICVNATCSPRARRLRNFVKIVFVLSLTFSISKTLDKIIDQR